jgi:hypothetical protein
MVSKTASGAQYAWDDAKGPTALFTTVPGAPANCTPTATHLARSNYVLLCQTPTGARFAQFNPKKHKWTAWQDAPIPVDAQSLVAAPLGSDVALAWLSSDNSVRVALWDPAAPTDLVARDVVDTLGAAVKSTSPVRMNAEIPAGSDTATTAYLTWRNADGVWRVPIQRAQFFANTIVAPAAISDANAGPVTEVRVSGGGRVAVTTANAVVSFLP